MIRRLQKMQDVVLKDEVTQRKEDLQHVFVGKDKLPPEQQNWRSGLDQEDSDPVYIKEEQEELSLTGVHVKSDNDDRGQLSQLNEHRKTDADAQDRLGPESDKNFDSDPQPHNDDEDSDSVELNTEGVCKETRVLQSGLKGLKNHVHETKKRRSTREKPFGCTDCDKQFDSRRSLQSHMVLHAGKRFSCSQCGRKFGRNGNLQRHMSHHKEEEIFCCSQCGKIFGYKKTLKRHMRTHTGEKPFICPFCNKSFTQAGSLSQHVRIHTGEKRFSCNVCNKKFTWKSSLNSHHCVCESSELHQSQTEDNRKDCGGPEPSTKSHPDPHLQPQSDGKSPDDPEPESEISDDDWVETRDSQFALRNVPVGKGDFLPGVVWDTTGKLFNCFKCGKEFDNRKSLQRHMTRHDDEKTLRCSVCKKCFRCTSELVKHTRIHTGEKPYSCLVCDKSFTRREGLVRHQRSHTGEKPFSCSLCLKRFRSNEHVVIHMRIHTGEKPFDCPFCGKAFYTNSKLTRHIRVHTGDKMSTQSFRQSNKNCN